MKIELLLPDNVVKRETVLETKRLNIKFKGLSSWKL